MLELAVVEWAGRVVLGGWVVFQATLPVAKWLPLTRTEATCRAWMSGCVVSKAFSGAVAGQGQAL